MESASNFNTPSCLFHIFRYKHGMVSGFSKMSCSLMIDSIHYRNKFLFAIKLNVTLFR